MPYKKLTFAPSPIWTASAAIPVLRHGFLVSPSMKRWDEVAYHKAVNGALETLLIPSATNTELKSLLQTGLKIFQGHLQHAEHVAADVK